MADEALLRLGTAKHIEGDFPRTLWTVADGEFLSTGTQEVEPGSRIPFHAHSAPEAEEVLTCLRGRGEIIVGEETHPFVPGQPWFVPRLLTQGDVPGVPRDPRAPGRLSRTPWPLSR
jgi:quercetin dioxygenase-like cupin family protein